MYKRQVLLLCKEGRIEGAYKKGRSWVLPVDAQKPIDNRIKTGAYRKNKLPPDLPLPVGISDYCLASTEYYYVDKTMMIKEFLDERPIDVYKRQRFGLPVYGESGNLERYNIFTTRMLVRCDEDGKLYLYDLVRTKKETSKPLEQ